MKTVSKKVFRLLAGITFISALLNTSTSCESEGASKSNVIIVITDDQGYVTYKPKSGWQTPGGMGIPVNDPSYGRIPPQKQKPEAG